VCYRGVVADLRMYQRPSSWSYVPMQLRARFGSILDRSVNAQLLQGKSLEANPRLLTTLVKLARLSDGRLCQTQLDVAMHACMPGQPQPLL
jgi:hypothetical protein